MLTTQKNTAIKLIGGYRYSFNGKEKIDEVAGSGNSIDFGARIYDPRVGRWLSGDPVEKAYPEFSTYSFAGNNPLYYRDIEGKYIVPTDLFTLQLLGSMMISQIGNGKTYDLLYNNIGLIHNLPKKSDLRQAMRSDNLSREQRKVAKQWYSCIVSPEAIIVQGVTYNEKGDILEPDDPMSQRARDKIQAFDAAGRNGDVSIEAWDMDETNPNPKGWRDHAEWQNQVQDFTILTREDPLLLYTGHGEELAVSYDTDGNEQAKITPNGNIDVDADLVFFSLPASPVEYFQMPNLLDPKSAPLLIPVEPGKGNVIKYELHPTGEQLEGILNLFESQTHDYTPAPANP